jgi:UDP-2-acetamido-3-amino-2,3-dideoxy-glucuronate N-acetyltransferase
MNTNNIALIGYGYWGQKIFRYLQGINGFHVKHVFFRGLGSLSENTIKKKYGNEFVSTIDSIMEDTSVSNVIIATPVDTHYEVTKQALLKSKNVLVEKPLATDPAHSGNLLKLAREGNLKLETEYTYTYSEALSHAQKLVEEGTIGEIESIVVAKKQLGRFLPYDVYTLLGTHCLSMLDMFIPIRGLSFAPKPLMNNNGIVTAAIISFESANKKCKGHIDISLHCPTRETKAVIYGTKGTIVYDPDSSNTLKMVCFSRFQPEGEHKVKITTEKTHQTDENNNLKRALEHFLEVIENRTRDNSERAISITEALSAIRGHS